jgi:nitric oxide reductase large subunit
VTSVLPIVFGLALGAGILMMARGVKRLGNRTLPDPERRTGFWWLNGGLLLAVASMVLVGFSA